MFENIVVYEDNLVQQFFPLVYLRSVFELKAGIFTNLERINFFFPKAKYTLLTRDYLKPAVAQRYPKYFVNTSNNGLKALVINGRAVITQAIVEEALNMEDKNFLMVSNHKVVMLFVSGNLLSEFMMAAKEDQFNEQNIIKFFRKNPNCKIVNLSDVIFFENIQSLIEQNGKVLLNDFKMLNKGGLILSDLNNFVATTKEEQIYIGKGTHIDPFVHLDATAGPIYIGENVVIKSNVVIDGPAFIDDSATIYPGYIRKNTTIGEGCRIGGEIENSIFLGNSNKYHAGFVGHSYIGEWVNIGAMATTSDLKNNYSKIKLAKGPNDYEDTNMQFLGSIIGDHVKIGIGSLLNAGTVIGIGCNLITEGKPLPKWIPAFSWSSKGELTEYDFNKFLDAVEKVYQRRNQKLLLPEKSLLEYLYRSV
ncbi:MAG: putative sugar nucleotidyl transferase [Candidatus Margulisbacteria bacterium]|nr:putative sugar nucleotidyl transferase [Candidatus Margulisiibacteriota bacterium]